MTRQRLEAQRAFYEEGRITIDRYIDASRQLMLAESAVSATREERLAAAKAHWDRTVEIQTRERAELEAGRGTVADVAEAGLAQEEAAVEYLQARQSSDTTEVQALKQRVETLEKQLHAVRKLLVLPGTDRK
jgi:capsule polysaccharide export protein KpsE/RkpR